MNLLNRLKQETRELHMRIEGSPPLMQPGLQFGEYSQLMARFYGFYLPVEKKLDAVSCLHASLPDWPERRKTRWLVKDLCSLGWTGQEIDDLPACGNLPSLSTIPEAFGCLYVLEGSTLGGQIISRHLEAILGLGTENGGAFFCGYGRQVSPMWKTFQAALGLVVRPEEQDRTVSSAQHTFRCLDEWLKDGPRAGKLRGTRPAGLENASR